MPLCTLKTNVSQPKLGENFESDLASEVARVLEKPIERQWCSVQAEGNPSYATHAPEALQLLHRLKFHPLDSFCNITSSHVKNIKVIVHIEQGAKIRRGGNKDEPIVWLNIQTIGRFNETSNPKYGNPLKKYLASTLSLEERNIVVSLQDLPAANLF